MSLDPCELFPEVPNLYEFPSVHSDMVHDEHRVNAYARAIRRAVKPGDIVADIGTGTGLLAFLCLRAGAARVHAIERSPIIDCAKELADVNGLSDRITFYAADSRDIDISDTVDVLVSELIGHIAFEEGMVETILDAKERFLKPQGTLIPQSVVLHAAPVSEHHIYDSCVDIWQPAYGIDYSPMRERAVKACYVTDISERDLVADHRAIFSVDFSQGKYPNIQTQAQYVARRRADITGVTLWFDAVLNGPILLSSGPWAKTHWSQIFAPIPQPILVEKGEEITVTFQMKLRTRTDDAFAFCVQIEKGRIRAKPKKG